MNLKLDTSAIVNNGHANSQKVGTVIGAMTGGKLENVQTETLKSTFALIPHHLYNNIPESFYAATAPQYYLVGADIYNVNNNSTTKAQYTLGEKYSEGVYCGQDTYGFSFENDKAVEIYHKEMYKG